MNQGERKSVPKTPKVSREWFGDSVTGMVSPRTSVIVAWLVIAASIGCYFGLDGLLQGADNGANQLSQATDGADGDSASPAVEGSQTKLWTIDFKELMIGRIVVTIAAAGSTPQFASMLSQQIEPMRSESQGPIGNLCAAILLARTGSDTDARTDVQAVIARVEADPTFAPSGFLATAHVVEKLIEQIAANRGGVQAPQTLDISDDDAKLLDKNLPWFGPLLVSTAHRDAAFEAALERSQIKLMIALVAFACIVLVAGLGGVVWLVILAVRVARNALVDPLRDPSLCGSTLPWMFAGWFIMTIVIAIALSIVVSRAERLSGAGALLITIVAMSLPLIAVMLPMRTGKSWQQIRRDIGLHSGRGVLRECAYGVTVYATAIPLLVVGAVLAMILALIFPQDLAGASHPIQKELFEGDGTERLLLLFIAAVVAPIVEEIIFRGVLFRHLRDLSRRWGRGLSFCASAIGSSVIFAAIHPQGIVFVPILGALAVAFCLAREMRGSLISCMVAHGINNALIVGLNIALAG